MGVMLLKSDQVSKCPKHVLEPSHYSPDGSCQCVLPQEMTLKKKEAAALGYQCPVCDVAPGSPCLHQNSSRRMHQLKRPHPERVRLIDPDYVSNGYQRYRKYRLRRIAGEEWAQSDVKRKASIEYRQKQRQGKFP